MSHLTPKPEPPTIDFDAKMVIAVLLGNKPTGGYAIRVEEMRETDGDLDVVVARTEPAAGAILTQAFTQPYDFVVVVKGEGEAQFREAE